jgi:hypothetical protein
MHVRYGIVAAVMSFTVSQAQAQSIDGMLSNVTDTLSDVTDVMFPGVTNIRIGLGPVLVPD